MRKNWVVRKDDPPLKKELSGQIKVSPITAQILINRGIKNAKDADGFLNPSLSGLHDPYLLKDMDKAVARIKSAIHIKENVLVYGDYDADGLSAAALVISLLKKLGLRVLHHIPNRLEDGYGLNDKIIKLVKEKKISLVITVDCGISAVDIIKELNHLKIDVVVTDHHQPQEKIPDAFAIINPLQKDCGYPFKHLSGVGVAFKLAQALLASPKELNEYLDLVTLGTIADVVPILGENRILVKHGLAALSKTKRLGIKALIEGASLHRKELSARNVSHIIGPRINAQGRLGSPESALRLLLTDSQAEAKELAALLEGDNKKRQEIEAKTLKEAMIKLEREINFARDRVIILHDDNWHKGVIGIVASRIVEQYYRPTIMVSLENGIGKGSGRSIKGFNLVKALSECKHHLEDFGGHEGACGLVITKEKLDKFKDEINKIAYRDLTPDHLLPSIDIEAEIDLEHLNQKLLAELEQLSPFGVGNPTPLFLSREVGLKTRPLSSGRDSLRFWVKKGKLTCEAFAYGKINFDEKSTIDLVYAPSLLAKHGFETIKLKVEDFR